MAYLCVDKDGMELIGSSCPKRHELTGWWFYGDFVELPHGSITKLIGRELTWEDEPVELK